MTPAIDQQPRSIRATLDPQLHPNWVRRLEAPAEFPNAAL